MILEISMSDLAYADIYPHGLIPCKVLNYLPGGSVLVKLTAPRAPYARGEWLEINRSSLVHRRQRATKRGRVFIRGAYVTFRNANGESV